MGFRQDACGAAEGLRLCLRGTHAEHDPIESWSPRLALRTGPLACVDAGVESHYFLYVMLLRDLTLKRLRPPDPVCYTHSGGFPPSEVRLIDPPPHADPPRPAPLPNARRRAAPFRRG